MADKSFKVKSGLTIPITSAAILTTNSSGDISSTSVLGLSAGGTGQTSANNALNALLPVQSGSTINYVLQSDGNNTSWQKVYNQGIQNNGTTVNPRRIVNFVGAAFTDSSVNDTTTITISGGMAAVSVSSNITLAAGNRYFVDTTAARTLTLPASPTLNDEIQIFDASGTANSYNITVARNGNLINKNAGNFVIDTNGGWYTLVYTGSTYGWKVG